MSIAQRVRLTEKRDNKTVRGYECDEFNIDVGPRDTDINLHLPNGETISVQFRVQEDEGLDICLPKDLVVTNWKGDSCEPATPYRRQKHVHKAQQLFISLPEGTLIPDEDHNDD